MFASPTGPGHACSCTRFGPSIVGWKCVTMREYMRTGILHSTGFYVASGSFMFFLSREWSLSTDRVLPSADRPLVLNKAREGAYVGRSCHASPQDGGQTSRLTTRSGATPSSSCSYSTSSLSCSLHLHITRGSHQVSSSLFTGSFLAPRPSCRSDYCIASSRRPVSASPN